MWSTGKKNNLQSTGYVSREESFFFLFSYPTYVTLAPFLVYSKLFFLTYCMQFRDDLHVEEPNHLTLAEPTRLRVRLASTTPARSGDLLRQCV
jgi:hypothetical protein